MRMPMNTISPLTLFWCVIYVLALFSVFIGGILAGNQDSSRPPQKNNQKQPNRNRCGFNPPQPPEGVI
jgi:hypothetical protein